MGKPTWNLSEEKGDFLSRLRQHCGRVEERVPGTLERLIRVDPAGSRKRDVEWFVFERHVTQEH